MIANSVVMDEDKVLLNNGQLGEIVRVEDAGEKGVLRHLAQGRRTDQRYAGRRPCRVFCAVGIAAEFILARRRDAVEEAEGLFLEALTLCEDRRAVQKVISGRDKRDVEALAEALRGGDRPADPRDGSGSPQGHGRLQHDEKPDGRSAADLGVHRAQVAGDIRRERHRGHVGYRQGVRGLAASGLCRDVPGAQRHHVDLKRTQVHHGDDYEGSGRPSRGLEAPYARS